MHKVAVIEDDYPIQQMYEMKLRLEGFEVSTADNGKIGLEVIEHEKPSLILLDLRMPIMGGEEMLQKLREKDWAADIRVVVLTNISKDEAPPSLRLLGVDRYIVKAHHTPQQVIDIIKEILS